MYVLPDTNVWISTRLLTSSIGAALTYYVARTNARILLPEIVERELEKQARKAARAATADIEKAVSSINRFTVEIRPEYPGEDEAVRSVQRRLKELEPHIRRVPFSVRLARAALDRVIEERAPSANKEQFRDAVLWETALSMSARSSVDVISGDGDFFEVIAGKRQQAWAISQDISVANGKLRLHADLPALLAAFKQNVPGPDPQHVATILDGALREHIVASIEKETLTLSALREGRVSAFRTARKSDVALSFELVYDARESATDDQAITSEVLAKGSCLYRPKRGEFLDISLSRLELPALSRRANRLANFGVKLMRPGFGPAAELPRSSPA